MKDESQPPNEEGNQDGEDEDWGDDWDNYGQEDDEMAALVKEAGAHNAHQTDLKKHVKDITITFRPPNYQKGFIA